MRILHCPQRSQSFGPVHFGHHDVHANQIVSRPLTEPRAICLDGFPAVHGDMTPAVTGEKGTCSNIRLEKSSSTRRIRRGRSCASPFRHGGAVLLAAHPFLLRRDEILQNAGNIGLVAGSGIGDQPLHSRSGTQ